MNGGASQILTIAAIVFLAIIAMVWHFSRSRSLLENWAAENGYRLLSSQYRNFSRGPFFWTTSKGQTVYRVTVQDRDGGTRSGWVRCGSWWGGLLSDKVQVRWDDEA